MVITLIIDLYVQFSFSIAAFWQHYAHCASIGGRTISVGSFSKSNLREGDSSVLLF